ncbi:MAG TPA: ferrous iron transporter B, partial [Fibrobacteria bacterium]|nr:ferrous iron transporter B [Fibrobacteria bacterium]
YPGATVEYMLGASRHLPGLNLRVMDTPGLASLVPASLDEQVTVDALFREGTRPSAVLAVADATQLARHLYLTRQLLDLGFPVVLAITMDDLLRKRGLRVDAKRLSELLDCPVFVLDPRKPGDLTGLAEAVRGAIASPGARPSADEYAAFAAASGEERISEAFRALDAVEEMAVRPVFEKAGRDGLPHASGPGADRILLHPVYGLAVFVAVMCGMFTAIFWMAAPIMDGIDAVFGVLVSALKEHLPDSWLSDLLADGVVGGTGAVMVFLPQIAILFLIMGWLEDSGYLARGAALVDRPLSKIGLNGRSFVPLLSGYACAIPALLAARTIPNRRERLLTLLIIPLMSCSARLPVYALLLAFLVPHNMPWLGGLALTGLYLLGFVIGALISTVATRMLRGKAGDASGFLLELPALRMPVPRIVLFSTWHKIRQYLLKAGPTILAIAVGLWILTHTPVQTRAAEGADREYVAVSHSYAAQLGHFIEPVTKPMGLDWRGGVAMISGFAAREVFVGSLALVYRVQDAETKGGMTGKLLSQLSDLRFEGSDHQRIFTFSTCIGILIFFLIALQCFPTVATVRSESGRWRFALAQLALFTGGAYVLAVAAVQGLRMLGFA